MTEPTIAITIFFIALGTIAAAATVSNWCRMSAIQKEFQQRATRKGDDPKARVVSALLAFVREQCSTDAPDMVFSVVIPKGATAVEEMRLELRETMSASRPTDPTIPEMISWLYDMGTDALSDSYDSRMYLAIRPILEHHEKLCDTAERIKLEAIRAFVDKASKHVEPLIAQPNYYGHFYIAIKEFLDEMEKANAGTND